MKTGALIVVGLFVVWFVAPTVWGVITMQRRSLKIRVLTQQTKKYMNKAVKGKP